MFRLKIVGTGKYLPNRVVTSEEVDRLSGISAGSAAQASGVKERRYVTDETNSSMGAFALMAALEKAHLKYEDLDAIISASGTMEQSIPCTAALIQKQLGKGESGTACFDINSTCLSFVTALDLASCLIETGRYRRIAIVSSEIASVGLNYKQLEASSLFGDGAAAAIVERTPDLETSKVLFSAMETFSSAAETCQIEGGGTKFHPGKKYETDISEKFLFAMQGRKIFRVVLEKCPPFFDRHMKKHGMTLDQIKLVIPHQASGSGMELMRRNLDIPREKWMDILENHGNMIAASIPLALHTAIEEGKIKRGDRVLLLGTSAGVSLGMLALEY